MSPRDPVHEVYEAACDLLEAARALEQATGRGGAIEAIPATLGTLEESLQSMSASCYRLAGECGSGAPRNRLQRSFVRGAGREWFSRESEAFLMSTLHDVASGIARSSRACREGREITAPLIARKLTSERSVLHRHLPAERHAAPRA